MIYALFTETVDAGNLLSYAAIVALGIALFRKDGGKRWKDNFEAEQMKVKLVEEQLKTTQELLEAEREKPNQAQLVSLTAQMLGSVGAISHNVRGLTEIVDQQKKASTDNVHALTSELAEQRHETAQAMLGVTSTLQNFGVLVVSTTEAMHALQNEVAAHEDRALKRHKAVMQAFTRSHDARTRKTDEV